MVTYGEGGPILKEDFSIDALFENGFPQECLLLLHGHLLQYILINYKMVKIWILMIS